MKKEIILGIGVFIIISFGYIALPPLLFSLACRSSFDKDYSVTELKEKFEKNKTNIYELKHYYNSIIPKNRSVEIEFEDNNTITRFGIMVLNSTEGGRDSSLFLDWNLKVNTSKVDSLIQTIGWTKETLKTIKEKLDKADCIQIKNGEPAEIGFKRSGMGMYSFIVFDNSIPDYLRDCYNDSCSFILANDSLVLEYGGGAIGCQCFHNFE